MGLGKVQRVVAIDWSGDNSTSGQRRKIWAGVWTAETRGGVYGGRVELENQRTRVELRDWIAKMTAETPRMVVGVDFCFSYPAWFVEEQGAHSAAEFWEIVTARSEHWLSHECEDARFWGRAGKHRDGKKPREFCGDGCDRMFRLADLACKVRGRILDPTEAEKVKGIAPKSPFQIGGAGAVGTGTLRGIPVLAGWRKAGLSVWPFDIPRLPILVEIYPRLLTGAVKKGRLEDRAAYLAKKQEQDSAYARVDDAVLAKARHSEDAFDALVSVMVMARERASFLRLEMATDVTTRIEGAVWGARVDILAQ